MKRFLLIFSLLLSFLIHGNTQPQRLAIMQVDNASERLLSVCIDFFREGPRSDNYTNAVDGDGKTLQGLEFNADDYNHTSVTRQGVSGLTKEPIYISTHKDLDGVSSYKKSFIKSCFLRLKTDHSYTIDDMQDDIWVFDILEKLGYIKNGLSLESIYNNALSKFGEDFFSNPAKPSNLQVMETGMMLELLKPNHKGYKKGMVVFKNPVSKALIAFDKIGPPAYIGSDLDNLSRIAAVSVGAGGILDISLAGFENDLREESFLLALKKKTLLSINKDIIITVDSHGEVWQEHSLLTSDFNTTSVKETALSNGQSHYSGNISVSGDDYFNAKVHAISNKKDLVATFFTRLVSQIKHAREKLVLAYTVRSIRKMVMEDMEVTSDAFIDALIVDEGNNKTIVHLRKGSIKILSSYASKK